MSGRGGSLVLVDPQTSGAAAVDEASCLGYQVLSRPAITLLEPEQHCRMQREGFLSSSLAIFTLTRARRPFYFLLYIFKVHLPPAPHRWLRHMFSIPLRLSLFPRSYRGAVWTASWPEPSSGSNLSPGARLRSWATLTLFELDPGYQIAPNITCYFRTVAVDENPWTTVVGSGQCGEPWFFLKRCQKHTGNILHGSRPALHGF